MDDSFTPHWDFNNATGTFFANVTTFYTLPTPITTAHGSTISDIATIYQTRGNEPVPEVVVTGPLSPLEPGKIMDPANANNTVPWGGTIEHGMDGDVPMTVVYDASEQPKYQMDDTKAVDLLVPGGGAVKATWVHEVPSGTLINETSESSLEYLLNGEKIGSIISHIPSGKKTCSAATWAESANAPIAADKLAQFSTEWNVPTAPARSDGNHIAIFNSVSPSDCSGGIFQPVLGYNWWGTGGKMETGYAASVWDLATDQDYTRSTSISGFTAGDTVVGTIQRSSSYVVFWDWYGQISKKGSSTSTELFKATKFTKADVDIDVALEGYNCASSDFLPGSITFSQMTITDRDGRTISPTFTGTVNRAYWPSDKFPGFSTSLIFSLG